MRSLIITTILTLAFGQPCEAQGSGWSGLDQRTGRATWWSQNPPQAALQRPMWWSENPSKTEVEIVSYSARNRGVIYIPTVCTSISCQNCRYKRITLYKTGSKEFWNALRLENECLGISKNGKRYVFQSQYDIRYGQVIWATQVSRTGYPRNRPSVYKVIGF